MDAGVADEAPEPLRRSPALRALYNNLHPAAPARRADRVAEAKASYSASGDAVLDLAIRIDSTVRQVKPDAFRGNQARENTIKAALLPLLNDDVEAVERIFAIIKAQREY